MELTYKQVEATLIAYLRIQPDRAHTFRSRIKQLQRMEFPPGVNVGRGSKMSYSSEHLFKLVTAFELIGIGLPAQSATTLVEKHWVQFSAAYALSALRQWHKPSGRIFCELILQSMSEIQFSAFGAPALSRAMVRDQKSICAVLASAEKRAMARVILKSSDTYERVEQMASSIAGVHISYLEVAEWRPMDEAHFIRFEGPYPDRSNLEVRRRLNLLNGNDPDAVTADGMEEARAFYEEYILGNLPF